MDPQKKASLTPDPEMLKELDILLNYDTLDEESDWDTMADLDAVEKDQDVESEGSHE